MTESDKPISVRPVKKSAFPSAPIHPFSAITTIVLDNLFAPFDAIETVLPPTLLLSGLAVGTINTLAVTLVQRFLAKDEWGEAIAKGVVMGIIAGVPYSVAGTATGALLLGWAGLHEWVKLPAPKE